MTSIPMLDVGAQNGPLEAELRAAFERVFASGRFILGPEVEALEQELAAYVGARHAIGVSSGTDALLVALMALEIGPGHEVVTTPFTFFATGGSIARVGATPVFVDIDPVTFNLDPAAVEAAITQDTRAIMPVHLYGQMADMEGLAKVAGDIPILEDAAQALGAGPEGARAGARGVFGCFSFFPSKNLGAFGDGGLVTTNDDALAERARMMRAHGAKPKYYHAHVGGNFRLDALQAALLRAKLPALEGWHAGRRTNATRYDERFADAAIEGLVTPARRVERHVFNQYVLRVPRRDALQAHLSAQGIASVVYYPVPLHLQACFSDLGYGEGQLPVTERACAEVLALPVYPELGRDGVDRVADAVIAFYRG